MSRMPVSDICRVRGMGVAERLITSTCSLRLRSSSFWRTPKRCSSSTTTSPRSWGCTSVLSRRWVPTSTSSLPAPKPARMRFCSAPVRKRILAGFGAGKLDVLVGTHRLLSTDVQPHDLGLVVVDEEQRFGVRQKELLRNLKLQVDVMSLSATPIPRTLQMSLTGIRDISVIETAPRGRHEIRTYIGEY